MRTDDGYALRLIVDGTIRPLINPPSDLTNHVGERVWVTGPVDAPPVNFGVIGGEM